MKIVYLETLNKNQIGLGAIMLIFTYRDYSIQLWTG